MQSFPHADLLVQNLLASAPIGIAMLDAELRYVFINTLLAESNGLPVASHIGRHPHDILPDVGPALEAIMQEVLVRNRPSERFTAQAEIPPQSGTHRYWEARYHPLHDQQGRACGIIAMVEDVTAKYEAERLQQEKESHTRRVLDTLFTFVGVLALDGTLENANRAPLEAADIPMSEVIGKKFWDCYWWSYSPEIQQQIRTAIEQAAQGMISRFDVVVRMAGDSRMTIDFMLAPLRDEKGNITHLIPSGIDISARKRGEDALRSSEMRFRQAVEAAPDGLMMIDRDGMIRLVNTRLESMFGYSRDELLGVHMAMLMPLAARGMHQQLMSAYLNAPQARPMANRRSLFALRKDHSQFPCEIGLNPLEIDGNLHILASVSDVTEKVHANQLIEKALKEKTVLLGEVHHRVKNNLQVISSLLSLQSRNAVPEIQAALTDSQNHVRTMAMIHQLLYERQDFSHIPLFAYLERLCHLLQASLTGATRAQLVLQNQTDDIALGLQQSVPLGLLVNEIVSNAFKHAFHGMPDGCLQLTLSGDAAHTVLVLQDNGAGLPQGLIPGETDTMGFQLIPMLAEQLHAQLRIETPPGGGTRFVIHFASSGKDTDHEPPNPDR